MVSLQELEKVSITLPSILEIKECYPRAMGWDNGQKRAGRGSNTGRDFEVNTD